MVTLLIMTNGRKHYFEQMLASIDKLGASISKVLIHDDSGELEYQQWLSKLCFNTYFTNKVGFTKSMISAWEQLKKDDNDWVFHLEDDFVFNETINIKDMIQVLSAHPYLVEMALLRQPIGARERHKGGIIHSHPEKYTQCTDGVFNWVEHRVNFTVNPTIYRKQLIYTYPWPDVVNSERHYSNLLFEDPAVRCAFWGGKYAAPKVTHIGVERKGYGH